MFGVFGYMRPMENGKTLDCAGKNYEENKHGEKNAVLLKPLSDDRGGPYIVSRIGKIDKKDRVILEKVEKILFDSEEISLLEDFLRIINQLDGLKQQVDFLVESKKGHVLRRLNDLWLKHNGFKRIFIDEAQFLEEYNIDEFLEFALKKNIEIHFYFLQSDFRGRMFPAIEYLTPMLSKLEHSVIAKCPYTGEPATMNIRYENGVLTFDGEQIAIDEEEKDKKKDDKKPVTTYKVVSLRKFLELKKEWEEMHGKI